MKTRYTISGAVVVGLCFAGAAHAGSIIVDALGGPVTLRSGDLSGLFASAAPHYWGGSELQSVHQSLQADGITTNGFVTFLLADTADGLGFLTLVDDNTVPGSAGAYSNLGMSTTGPSSANYFINDAFAWTGLAEGDGFTFNFTEMTGDALASVDTFQFVTWNGQAWEVVSTAEFNPEGQFAFSFTVVPLPAPVLMGLAGLAGVIAFRRRRLA